MAARSLAARKNNAHIERSGIFLSACHHCYNRHAVSVREQLFDSLLIGYRAGLLTLLQAHTAKQCLRHLGLIRRARNL